MKITTTFEKLHAAGACIDRYRRLGKALGGITKYGRRTPINLLQILEYNGLEDFFWVLGTVEDNQIFRLMAADFAQSVLPLFERELPADSRPRDTIETARRFARGEATDIELAAAWAAAWAAAGDAAGAAARDAAGAAAWDAAGAAAGDAAWAAAGAAAWDAAWDAAGAAAGDAAWAAAGAAAWDAEKKKQIAIIRRYLK